MIAEIVWELEQAFAGDPWHGPSFVSTLDGVSAEIAGRKPPGGAHSIWEIVRHVEAWQREVARRVLQGDWQEPAMGDWPGAGVGEADWAATLGSLRESQARLLAAVRAMPESRLNELLDVSRSRNPEVGAGYTFAVLLHGQAQHLAYHGGQIAVLKRVVS